MVYEIIWTQKAKTQFQEQVEYLRINWTERIAKNFVNDVQRRIDSLSVMPFQGAASESDRSVRRLVVTRQLSLIYSVQDPVIFLLSFADNRRDPAVNQF